jgi:hypothetical protein
MVLGVSLILGGCKKYPAPVQIIDEAEVCEELPTMKLGVNVDYMHEGPYSFFGPRFNPQNPEEIFYYRANNDLPITESNRVLKAYNMRTGEYRTVLAPTVGLEIAKFDPSANGWVLIQSTNNEIWKIKADGTGLLKITDKKKDGDNINPSWSADGNYISYYNKRRQLNIVGDVIGTTVDSFKVTTNGNKGGLGNVRFSNFNNLVVARSSDGTIYQYNTVLDKQIRVVKTNADVRNEYAMFPSNNDMLLIEGDSIFNINLANNGSKQFLRGMCPSKIYSEPSISPAGDRIIFTKDTMKKLSDTKILDLSEIWIMDSKCYHAQRIDVH